MRKFAVVLALLGFMAQAQAVQEVQARHDAPLQPLHWCRHADGQTLAQRDPCSADQTEMSSVMVRKPGGDLEYVPLDQASAPEPAPEAPAAAASSPEDAKEFMKDFRTRMLKWLGFALAVAVVAKLLKRSFVLWFILGFVLRAVLVAANVMAF
jgi:hypothetical protein